MKYLFFITLFCVNFSFAQELQLVVSLVDSIQETSGLIYLNQKLITHNDSANEPYLYEIDTLTGAVTRAVYIENSTNIDWEDLAFDNDYIYISDFGNNNGARTDLKIFKISRLDYFTTTNDTVSVDTISFTYADQVDFTPTNYTTNFDAEALISYGDSLYIFTKNWGDAKSNIYALSKNPGTYSIPKIDSINSLGLVTGATYSNNSIFLSGYTFFAPFLIEISNFIGANFSLGNVEHYTVSVPTSYSFQIEGITNFNVNEYYVSAEISSSGSAALYKFHLDSLLEINSLQSSDLLFHPNPASEFISFDEDVEQVLLFDAEGKLQLQTTEKTLQISTMEKGAYVLELYYQGKIIREKIIID